MPSLVKRLKKSLTKGLRRIQAHFQKLPVGPSPGMGADTHTPIPSVGSPPLPGVPPLTIQVETSNPIPCALATEKELEELADRICRMAIGATGGVIGGVIGRAAGTGIITGAVVGWKVGDFAYDRLKEWLFTEWEDGVRPIDMIADKLRAAGSILMTAASILIAAAETSTLIASRQKEAGRTGE